MELISHTPSKLIITHREPISRVVTVLACLALIVSGGMVGSITAPPDHELSGLVTVLLALALLMAVSIGIYAAMCSETYTFDRDQQSFKLEHTGTLRSSERTGRLPDIGDVYQESQDDNDTIKEYVFLVLDPDAERVRLPMKLYSFTAEERQWCGELLCAFLDIPVRVDQK